MGTTSSHSPRPEVIEDLQKEMSLSQDQIRQLYHGYQNICSESKSWPKSFNLQGLKNMYDDCEVGAADRLAEYLFGAMDADGNGSVDFREYVLTSIVYLTMDERQKVTWLFNMFDHNKTGHINREELTEMVDACLNMMPCGAFDVTMTTDDIVDEILKNVDMNGDNKISLNEFIPGAKNCPTLRLLLKFALKFARKPFAFCHSKRQDYRRERSRSRSDTLCSLTSLGST